MLPNYHPDEIALGRDPNLKGFEFDPGYHATVFSTSTGQAIYESLCSRIGVAMLIGGVCSAPSRPPVVAAEPLLAWRVGEEAFSDDMKRLTGRIVRYILEHVGGAYEARGVKVTKSLNSHYVSGSTYSFPAAIRR